MLNVKDRIQNLAQSSVKALNIEIWILCTQLAQDRCLRHAKDDGSYCSSEISPNLERTVAIVSFYGHIRTYFITDTIVVLLSAIFIYL